ncbi:MAG: NAD-dependent epimerase/dehydratase family protein [Pyrobaculum sp.]
MIVVTGASGFIGWALVEELLRRGEKVLAVSRSGSAPEGADRVAHDVRKPLVVDGNPPGRNGGGPPLVWERVGCF